MEINRISGGMFDSNAWLVSDNGMAVLVDAGVSAVSVNKALEAANATLQAVVLTHGHLDHICQLGAICSQHNVPVMAHHAESALLEDDMANGFALFGYKKDPAIPVPSKWLSDEEEICVGTMVMKVLHTPGHTAGGICLYENGHLITGDTIFKRSVGRTDLVTGDGDLLLKSIRSKLMSLPDETVVHPGHGDDTTIGSERMLNPYVRE